MSDPGPEKACGASRETSCQGRGGGFPRTLDTELGVQAGPHGNIAQRQALAGAWGAILEESAKIWTQLLGGPPDLWPALRGHLIPQRWGGRQNVPGGHCGPCASEVSGIFHTVVIPFPSCLSTHWWEQEIPGRTMFWHFPQVALGIDEYMRRSIWGHRDLG